MKGKLKRAQREVSKLHGATATFVSLVDRGANETPFTEIKAKSKGNKPMGIKKRKNSAKSHKDISTSKKDRSTPTPTEMVVAKMVFDGDTFENKESVEKYLEDAEWEVDEQIVIEKDDDGNFVAFPEGTEDDDYLKLGKVDADDEGVTAFVGEREISSKEDDSSEEDNDEDEVDSETKGSKKKPYKKAAPSRVSKRQQFIAKRKEDRSSEKKFDSWDAKYSHENTLAKALAAGMEWDGVPPGFYEVQAAFNGVVSTIVADDESEGKQDSLNKAAMDFAEIIGGLDTFFDGYVNADAESVEKAYADQSEREALAKWADGYGDFVAGKSPEAATLSKSDDVAIDYNKVSETVADLVKKAVEPLTKSVEGVTDTVEAMASRHPTKKASDPTDGSNEEVDTDTDTKIGVEKAERFASSFLG